MAKAPTNSNAAPKGQLILEKQIQDELDELEADILKAEQNG